MLLQYIDSEQIKLDWTCNFWKPLLLVCITLWFLFQSFKLKGLRGQNYFALNLQVTTSSRYGTHQCHWCLLKEWKCWPVFLWMFLQPSSFMWRKSISNLYITSDKTANLQGSERFSWSKWFFKDVPEEGPFGSSVLISSVTHF